MNNYVYVVDFGELVKVGVSSNVTKRISSVSSQLNLDPISTYTRQSDNAYEVESYVKTRLNQFHIKSDVIKTELFNCDFFTACKAVDFEMSEGAKSNRNNVGQIISSVERRSRIENPEYKSLFDRALSEVESVGSVDSKVYLMENYGFVNELELYMLISECLQCKLDLIKLKDKVQMKIDQLKLDLM